MPLPAFERNESTVSRSESSIDSQFSRDWKDNKISSDEYTVASLSQPSRRAVGGRWRIALDTGGNRIARRLGRKYLLRSLATGFDRRARTGDRSLFARPTHLRHPPTHAGSQLDRRVLHPQRPGVGLFSAVPPRRRLLFGTAPCPAGADARALAPIRAPSQNRAGRRKRRFGAHGRGRARSRKLTGGKRSGRRSGTARRRGLARRWDHRATLARSRDPFRVARPGARIKRALEPLRRPSHAGRPRSVAAARDPGGCAGSLPRNRRRFYPANAQSGSGGRDRLSKRLLYRPGDRGAHPLSRQTQAADVLGAGG